MKQGTDYTISAATVDDIDELLRDIRYSDLQEMHALSSSESSAILEQSINISFESYTLRINKRVACIYGVGVISLIDMEGAPWLIGTNLIARYPKLFMSISKEVSKSMLSKYRYLRQWVDVRNQMSILWLKRLGFKFHDSRPIGRNGEEFYLFTMENEPCA